MHARSQLISVALLLMAHSASPPVLQHSVLVGTMGRDTVAVDRYVRDSTSITGVILVRRPQIHMVHYKATLAPPQGRFTHLELTWRDVRGAELRSAITSYGIDSIRTQVKENTLRSYGVGTDLDAIPLPPRADLPFAYAILEHVGVALLNINGPRVTEQRWLAVASPRLERHRVRRIVGDTLHFDFPAGPVLMHMDADKRLVWMSIGIAPVQTIVRRSEKDIDIDKLAASFAGRDLLRH